MKFVEDWAASWRWISMQCYAGVTALNMAWVSVPADLKTHYLNVIVESATVLLGLMGMFGRLVQQQPKDGDGTH